MELTPPATVMISTIAISVVLIVPLLLLKCNVSHDPYVSHDLYRQQRLQCGFPPRELYHPSDSSQPLNLANGDRVLVDLISDQSEQPQKGRS